MEYQNEDEKIQQLKRLVTTVYLCQVLAFGFLGIPLLLGIAISLLNRSKAQGTWLESHFIWQIYTFAIGFIGFVLAGLFLGTGIELYVLLPTVILIVYRVVIGWNALNANKVVKEKN